MTEFENYLKENKFRFNGFAKAVEEANKFSTEAADFIHRIAAKSNFVKRQISVGELTAHLDA